MKLVKLSCPACAGALELPDNLTVAHCIYCGNKIMLDQDGVIQERRDIERYIELCKVAVQAKNHNDVIRYCNLILEIEPKNIDAWINKAVSTFWLTTAAQDRYHEALQYLHEASQFAPNDQRIEAVRRDLAVPEAAWLVELANGQVKIAISILNIPSWSSREAARDNLPRAMEYYLAASDLAPDSIPILEAIKEQVQHTGWMNGATGSMSSSTLSLGCGR